MTDELIIKNWRMGLTVKSITKKYKKEEDRKRKRTGENKITNEDAWSYVERVIYKYQTSLMKGE